MKSRYNLWEVSLPIDDGFGSSAVVRVYPNKVYGNHTGKELIDKYKSNQIIY
jgi:hypothetical protein